MNEEKRTNIFLDIKEAVENMGTEEACLYIYGHETFDAAWAGHPDVLIDIILDAMRTDEEIKRIMREAVRAIDLEEGVNLRVN